MPTEPNPPKVFISYSHDSQEHFDRVLLLSDVLREWGIDCHIDQYELAPADWVRWMERRIREADFVLIVCTATYRRRFDGEEEPGKGLGVRHEGGVISAELYNRQTETAKFVPVVFSLADAAHIPSQLQNTHRHQLDMEKLENDRGFENLYRHLTGQPRVVRPPLGKLRSFEPVNRLHSLPLEDRQQEFVPIREEAVPKAKNIPATTLCRECGAQNDVGSRYCGECAAWLELKGTTHPRSSNTQTQSPDKPQLRHENFTEDLGNSVKLEMIAIPGGSFLMGSEGFDNTKPVHLVKLSPFHIGKFQVTQQQWQAVMKTNPSHFKGKNLPVEQVSWNDAFEFCLKLSEKTGKEYRLPTEAEWEYACLAGSTGKYCFGDDEALLKDYSWYDENSGDKTQPAGEKKPNNWGLHDMHGNVWEWCSDWYDKNYYAELSKRDEAVDLQGPANGQYRVLRGGSWVSLKGSARAVCRLDNDPAARNDNVGFRLVLRHPPSS